MAKHRKTPEVCPVCGEDVPRNAKACPDCGACHQSGWGEEGEYDGVDLPDDEQDFNYDEFVEREFKGKQKLGFHPLWWITAAALLAWMLWSMFG